MSYTQDMKWIVLNTLVLLGWLLPLSLLAQTRQELKTRFENARTLVDLGKFPLALEELMPLTEASPQNTYAADASYLYAYAALQAGERHEAALMLQQLLAQHPSWAYYQDALFLMANVLFELKEYEQALQAGSQVNVSRLKEDVRALKHTYLSQITDKARYQRLLQKFAEEQVLAQVYADKLLAGWYTDQDRPTLERIVSLLKLDRNTYLNQVPTGRKKQYNVAVMLPFQLQQTSPEVLRRNQFITDLYAGIQMAQDSLAKSNIQINLFAYDTGADSTQIKELLELPEITTMDLIIGPVYKSSSRVVARYAAEHQIMNVNPLSQDKSLTQDNPYLLLFESSIVTQAQQAAAYAYENFTPKTSVILFTATRDDTVYARHYLQHYTQLGGQVKLFQKVETLDADVRRMLTDTTTLQEIGHLAIFSSSPSLAINTLSLLGSQSSKLPVLAPADWLYIQQISLAQLDNNEIYFLYPKYVDAPSPAIRKFRKSYLARYNLPPSVYAYGGFEMLFYFGNLLHQYGPHFNRHLARAGFSRGAVFQGMNYTSRQATQYENDNQFVPILKLDNLQLHLVNRPY